MLITKNKPVWGEKEKYVVFYSWLVMKVSLQRHRTIYTLIKSIKLKIRLEKKYSKVNQTHGMGSVTTRLSLKTRLIPL